MTTTIVSFLLTSLAAGVLGGVAMEGVLWLIGRAGWAKAGKTPNPNQATTFNRNADFIGADSRNSQNRRRRNRTPQPSRPAWSCLGLESR